MISVECFTVVVQPCLLCAVLLTVLCEWLSDCVLCFVCVAAVAFTLLLCVRVL